VTVLFVVESFAGSGRQGIGDGCGITQNKCKMWGEEQMDFIEWKDSYSTGIALMDKHHQRLVALINQLYAGVFACEDVEQERALTASILVQLEDYAEYHFTVEEQLMSEYHFSEYTEHLSEHDAFREKITALSSRLSAGEIALSFSTFEFLRDWLTDHILVNDKKYGPFLREKGVN
jgi:hemerythrin